MKNILLLLTCINISLLAETCPLCELHRAYNAEHPGEYDYYEDYLDANQTLESNKK